jgi:catechol 2,3-dioxygenase-like lactoylglutathione lyase family enzyme
MSAAASAHDAQVVSPGPRSAPVLAEFPVFPILLSLDLDASRAFYHGVLGLEIAREDQDDRIVFRCGGGTQLVVTRSTIGTLDSQTQVAWRVPDIHAAIADLRARGVRIEEYEAPDPVTTDGVADMGHSWAAWFIDPSRNVLAVVEPKG